MSEKKFFGVPYDALHMSRMLAYSLSYKLVKETDFMFKMVEGRPPTISEYEEVFMSAKESLDDKLDSLKKRTNTKSHDSRGLKGLKSCQTIVDEINS